MLDPPKLYVKTIHDALPVGREILSGVPTLSPELLLAGATHFVKHQWPQALAFLWTSVEQVLGQAWKMRVIDDSQSLEQPIPGRKDFLKDFRTWSASTKVEVLFQKGLMGPGEYALISVARKARNDFIHVGTPPSQTQAEAALDGLLQLISLVTTEFQDKDRLGNVATLIRQHFRGEFIPKRRNLDPDECSHWLPIPPIPGDPQWGDKPYERIPELQLKPLDGDG